jgi:Rieske Fe-S protein
MTYAVGALVPRGSVPRYLLWDTLDPYHYIRLQPLEPGEGPGRHDVLVVGGEDHKAGQAGDETERHDRLEAWARERFPMMGEVRFRWSGMVMETIDGLGFLGRNPGDAENVYIATGDSGMGMTHGTIAGILLTDLIQGRDNEWATLYDPARRRLKAAGEFLKENLNVAGQYASYFTGGEVGSVDEIPPGHGAIVRRGLKKIAVYRDEQGHLCERSAICTHLGCVVDWNDVEKTWDCPCHGTRYNAGGTVIHGPAVSDLGDAGK